FILSCQPNQKQKIWKESNGIVIIEAENVMDIPVDSNWKVESTLSGRQSTGYVTWRGDDTSGPESLPYDSLSTEFRLSYQIDIETPGTYHIRVLNQHQMEDGDNDVWISLNRGDWGKTYDWQINEWSLDERGDWAKAKLDKGIHVVELGGRSAGFSIDRILVFHDQIEPDSVLILAAESEIVQ
ncbi:MAG: hypothetical protein ACFCUU_10945, partial [Cyclobacteriaceae bacterium]